MIDTKLNPLIYNKILLSITTFTITAQLYALYLVQFQSPKPMLEYRYFLKMFIIFDMLFTIVIDTALAPSGMYGMSGSFIEGWAKYSSPEFQLFCVSFTWVLKFDHIDLAGVGHVLWSNGYYISRLLFNLSVLRRGIGVFKYHSVSEN